MASEPTEEAISSFISFTNSSREQAITLLKVSGSVCFIYVVILYTYTWLVAGK